MTYPIAVELPTASLGLAVACSVAGAVSYGLSNVLQQREAEQIAQDQTLKLGLLKQLARRPRWLVGIGADVGGYVFEALALGLARSCWSNRSSRPRCCSRSSSAA